MTTAPHRRSFNILNGIFSLAGLLLSVALYLKYGSTLPGLAGFAVLLSLTVLSFFFRIIATIVRFVILLALLAAGLILLIR